MIGIYWDTSTEWIVVEIFRFDEREEAASRLPEPIYSYLEERPREASTYLVPEIQRALEKSGIERPDWIFVARGPGSFTGIRISVSAARNLSQLWKIPCLGLDTVQIYRRYYHQKFPGQDVITVIDGNLSSLYVALERGTFDMSREKWKDFISQLWGLPSSAHSEQGSLPGKPLVFSRIPLDTPHKLLSEDFPRLTQVPIEFFWNPDFAVRKETFTFHLLIPNYMRESYVTKPPAKN